MAAALGFGLIYVVTGGEAAMRLGRRPLAVFFRR
jgi:hypothetical protein